jgi:hypothetical protein
MALARSRTAGHSPDVMRWHEGHRGGQIRARRQPADQLMAAICSRFGLDQDCPAEVKAADNRILGDERDALTVINQRRIDGQRPAHAGRHGRP